MTAPSPSSDVLTLSDLDAGLASGTSLAVLGHPIKHSISPAMHNAALREMEQASVAFAGWRYFRFDVVPEELPIALKKLHDAGFQGLNLTVPHKVLAFNCVESVDPSARSIGAVNTLLRTPTGWAGFNTDGYGLAMGLKEDLGTGIAGAHFILLGAGGAARGAAVELLERGCASLSIGNRTRDTLDALLEELSPLAPAVTLRGFALNQPPADLPAGAWVVNATSVGLREDQPPPIDLARVPSPRGVYDMIYNPPMTPLLARAGEMRLPAANGLSMLVHQGARALGIWTGAEVPVAIMREAAAGALRRQTL